MKRTNIGKTSSRTYYGKWSIRITPVKKQHLRATAFHYLQTHQNLPELWRIDLVAVEFTPEGKTSRIELIENAVDGD